MDDHGVDRTANASAPTTEIRHRQRIKQNFMTIWLKTDQDTLVDDNQLRHFVPNIECFMDTDECIDFLLDMEYRMVSLIITGILGERIISLIHDIPQINPIVLFSPNHVFNEQSVQIWSKVRIIDPETKSIHNTLNQTTKDCNRHNIPISFISSDEDFSQKKNETN